MLETLEPYLQRPIEHLSLIFTVVMLLLLVAPLLARKLKLPGVVGLLIAGAIVGPNALGLLERDVTFQLLGQVGLVYIMFLAGLEIDLNRFIRYKNHSLVFGALTFLFPQVIGTVAGIYILEMDFIVAVLMGSMIASHTLLAYPAVSRLGLSKNSAVTTAVGGTIITDTAALIVLAVVLGAWSGDLDANFWITLALGLTSYTFLVFWGIPKIGRWFFRKVSSEGVVEYVFVLTIVFAAAVLSEIAGVKDIIGAFLAGLALNRLIPESSTLMNRIEFVGNALFIPFFLISVGMLVNVKVLVSSVDALIVTATMLVAVIVGKYLAAVASQKILKQSSDEAMIVFGLSVAQAAATLAVVLVAFDEGIFDEAVLNGSIVVIAVTCFLAPLVVEHFGRKVVLAEQDGSAGGEGMETPQRFLVPMAYAKTSENLLDLTFLVRDQGSQEPVFPISVVLDDEDTAARVAQAEQMLSAAVVHGAAAEVPVVPVTSVAHNPASGIARAAVERRISDIIVGWQGPATATRGVYGHVTDQLLAETEQQVMICNLTQPIATIKRVIAVFPPNIEYHRGYTRAVGDIKRLTNHVGALLTGLCIKEDIERIRSRVNTVRPELASSFVGFNTMEDLITTLKKRVEENDLVVFLTARRGTVPWSPELEQLPGRLRELAEHSLSFVYLSDQEFAETGVISGPVSLADRIVARRVVVDLQADDEVEAIKVLLQSHFDAGSEGLEVALDALVQGETTLSRELTNGSLLLNARTSAVDDVLIFFATAVEGLETSAHRDQLVRGIVILLSPKETSLQDHLELFSELGDLVTRIEDVPRLVAIESQTALLEELRRLAADKSATFPGDDQLAELQLLREEDPHRS